MHSVIDGQTDGRYYDANYRSCILYAIRLARDVVLGLGPWSLVVLKDKIAVLGLGLELQAPG